MKCFSKELQNKKCKSTKAVYVSNALPYKHHEKVVEAVKLMRERGDDIELTLIGVDRGLATEKLFSLINEVDEKENFILFFNIPIMKLLGKFLKKMM